MALKKVCGRGALMSGETIAVTAGDRRVLLVESGGKLCAYEDRCPHKGVPLSEGALSGTTLTCRAHHWTFDAATGRGINPDSAALFPVSFVVADDEIWIDEGEDRKASHAGAGGEARARRYTPSTVPRSPGSAPVRASYGDVPERPSPPSGHAELAAAARVGPVLLAGVVTDAVIEAIREAHANAQIVDQGSYLRVLVPDRCVIRASAVGARLGAPFRIPADLEPLMCSFKGVFTASDEEAVFEARRRL